MKTGKPNSDLEQGRILSSASPHNVKLLPHTSSSLNIKLFAKTIPTHSPSSTIIHTPLTRTTKSQIQIQGTPLGTNAQPHHTPHLPLHTRSASTPSKPN